MRTIRSEQLVSSLIFLSPYRIVSRTSFLKGTRAALRFFGSTSVSAEIDQHSVCHVFIGIWYDGFKLL